MDFQYLVPLETVRQIYIMQLVSCKSCHKPYIGGTVQIINECMSGHGKNRYKVLSNEDVDETRDDYSLGLF